MQRNENNLFRNIDRNQKNQKDGYNEGQKEMEVVVSRKPKITEVLIKRDEYKKI